MVDKRDKWVYVAILLSLISLSVSVFLSMIILCKPVDAWWNTSWDYSQEGNISANVACGDLAGYQIRFNLDYGVGASTANTTFTNGHSQTDFDDIRFVLNGTVLPHWIEVVNVGVDAIVWVNFTMIPVAGENFYIYYGNLVAPDISNGNTTWNFFDDFPGAALQGQWNIDCGNPDVAVAGGILTITNVGGGVDTIGATTFVQNDYRYLSNVTVTNGAVYWGMIEPSRCGAGKDGVTFAKTVIGNERVKRYLNNVATNWPHVFPASPFTARILKNGSWARWIYNDVLTEAQNTFASVNVLPFIGSETNAQTISMDWVAIGELCRPEPAWGAWSAEKLYVPPAETPTGLVVADIGSGCVNVSWIAGVNSTGSWVEMGVGECVTTVGGGEFIYNGTANFTIDCGLTLETNEYCYSVWAYNSTGGFSDYICECEGGTMIQFGVIAFIALAIAFLAFWQKKLWIFLLAGMAWVGFWGYCWTSYAYGSVMWYFGILGIAAGLILFVAPAWFRKEKEPYERREIDTEYQKDIKERKKQARARLRGED